MSTPTTPIKTVGIIYKGPLPEIQVEVAQGRHIEAKLDGKPIVVPEHIANELVARGDFIPAAQTRDAFEAPPRGAGVHGDLGGH